jgi:hypothetical protein
MRKMYLLIQVIFLLTCISVSAKEIDALIARKIATNFFLKERQSSLTNLTAGNLSCNLITENYSKGNFYIFDFSGNSFVIVSGDDAAIPVLAYSYESGFDENNIPPAVEWWLSNMKDQIAIIKKNKPASKSEITKQWTDLLNWNADNRKNVKRSAIIKSVAPLIKTKWDQLKYYNEQCPADIYGGPGEGHMPTGCVATAMAQILKYWGYPHQGRGTHTLVDWRWPEGLTADYGNTVYDWAAMPNSINKSNFEIAQLMYHCGIAVNMHYFYSESGSNIADVPKAMYGYFRYRVPEYHERSEFKTDAEWSELIMDNLDLGEPVLYAGTGNSGGHAFICDGYQDSSYFHINWGWSGVYNGYFHLNNLNTGEGDFTNSQRAVVNIAPFFYPFCKGDKIMEEDSGTFNDGSAVSKYWNNTDCSWLISLKDSSAKVALDFIFFDSEVNKDILKVYDGEDISVPLLGTFSGQALPQKLISSGNKMYIRFVTDSMNKYNGWEAKYKAVLYTGIKLANNETGFTIYPNPTASSINIKAESLNLAQAKICIVSAYGQNIYEKDILPVNQAVNITVDVSDFPKGLYIVKIISGKSVYSRSVFVL